MREEIAQMPKHEAEKVLELPNYYYDKGVKEGVEQGIEQGIEKVVYNMIKNGFSDEVISTGTGLSLDKIAVMREKREGH